MADARQAWHTEVITPAVERVLARCGAMPLLDPFYLAGGTALALYFGTVARAIWICSPHRSTRSASWPGCNP